jgi:hypothetical protein
MKRISDLIQTTATKTGTERKNYESICQYNDNWTKDKANFWNAVYIRCKSGTEYVHIITV